MMKKYAAGLHAYDLGFRREYERLQQENLDTTTKAGLRRVVVACGRCQPKWREHASLVGGGFEVLHGVEYLGCRVTGGKLKSPNPFEKSYLSRLLPLGARLRHTRSAARGFGGHPGVEVVEMRGNQRWAWCCGGGGDVPEADPSRAKWSATDLMREAKDTGAELILPSTRYASARSMRLNSLLCRPKI